MSSTNTKAIVQVLMDLGKQLQAEVMNTPSMSSLHTCQTLLDAIQTEAPAHKMTIDVLQQTKIGVTLGKVSKALKRHKRTETIDDDDDDTTTTTTATTITWSQLVDTSQALIATWKKVVQDEERQNTKQQSSHAVQKQQPQPQVTGLPTSVSEYRTRLTRHDKELYKDPPVMPPARVPVNPTSVGPPKRDPKTGLLTFSSPETNQWTKDFHPNRTPEEVLRAGAFGGTYFRSIHSGVTNQRYTGAQVVRDTLDPSWIQGLDASTLLTSAKYRNKVNKFGVKCGGSLGMWESSGWISDVDPYGWFQWYCRFYQGRRCGDDARQIARWQKSVGPKGRFRSQLCNTILAAGTSHDDASISPVIRQTLLHWGMIVSADVLEKHRKRVGK